MSSLESSIHDSQDIDTPDIRIRVEIYLIDSIETKISQTMNSKKQDEIYERRN